ncbi:hypothetical protein EHS13_26380 [Paenibacillus psychroresistens]|uniref:Uncharacterized protein n=1 Tax=Paenibacillus psychroresistens TaxID=1778678 RepID=A0A6B8RP86_9BACL|nr:hypothetical protein [Paenibacillus psychroresistens]QGQ98160.1 hypothetical protein EHS13_26380 [Paenibacillus psychroresistens]
MKEEILGQKQHYPVRANLMLNEIILWLRRQGEAPVAENRLERLFYARKFNQIFLTQQWHTSTS